MGTSLWHVRPSLYVLQVYIKTYLKDNFFIWAIFLGGGRFSLIYTVRGHNVSFFFSRCSDNSIGCFESAN